MLPKVPDCLPLLPVISFKALPCHPDLRGHIQGANLSFSGDIKGTFTIKIRGNVCTNCGIKSAAEDDYADFVRDSDL